MEIANLLLNRTSQLWAGGAVGAIILRTRWDWGMDADSFLTKVLQWEGQNESLRPSMAPLAPLRTSIVDDQISDPAWVVADSSVLIGLSFIGQPR